MKKGEILKNGLILKISTIYATIIEFVLNYSFAQYDLSTT